MEKKLTYCQFVANLDKNDPNRIYHDTQYGFPLNNDNELFGRLILEINQAGLSWTTILKKQDNFRNAYSNFNIEKIAAYNNVDINRLLNDSGIIRNKLKINAAIYNAQQVIDLQKEFGSFKAWLNNYQMHSKDQWVKLFKKTFKFTGGEITGEFLMSTGYIEGAHEKACPVFHEVIALKPTWSAVK